MVPFDFKREMRLEILGPSVLSVRLCPSRDTSLRRHIPLNHLVVQVVEGNVGWGLGVLCSVLAPLLG